MRELRELISEMRKQLNVHVNSGIFTWITIDIAAVVSRAQLTACDSIHLDKIAPGSACALRWICFPLFKLSRNSPTNPPLFLINPESRAIPAQLVSAA
jgi:hypothetical protein